MNKMEEYNVDILFKFIYNIKAPVISSLIFRLIIRFYMERWPSWSMVLDWKSSVRETVPRVRIPISPPIARATGFNL